MTLLRVQDIGVSFGGVKAVRDLSFTVAPGEVFSIVGPNGAGKTTVFNLISRIYRSDQGSIAFDGRGHHPERRPTPSPSWASPAPFRNTELFERETVLKNLLIGCHIHRKSNLLSELFFLPSVRRTELAFRRTVEDVIDLLDLQSHRDKVIGELPFGVRKMVEIARALCMRPKLLLLERAFLGPQPGGDRGPVVLAGRTSTRSLALPS